MTEDMTTDFLDPSAKESFWCDGFKASVNYYFSPFKDYAATIEIFDRDENISMMIFTMHNGCIKTLETLPENIKKKYKPAIQDALLDFITYLQDNVVQAFYKE